MTEGHGVKNEEYQTVDPIEGDAAFIVSVDGYEGPLDLLLSLARDQKVDLKQISILALVDQYIAFIAATPELRLDLVADYVVMAAWLALLKSRLLLPENIKPEERRSAEDDATQLARRLQCLAKLRAGVAWLDERPRLGRDWMPPGALSESGPKRIGRQTGAGLMDLLAAFVREAKRNAPPRIPALEPFDLRSVDDAIQRLMQVVGTIEGWKTLQDMLPSGGGSLRQRSEAATHFVAMLELARTGKLEFRQEEDMGAIWIRRTEAPHAE